MQAFAETEDSAVGESIYTPSSSCLSITDSLDLSLVKVYQDKVERCEFGLRNSEDKLVKGNISVADQSEMYDMKLYKWGAKTKLTKGIYKGAVFVKKGEKFDSHIHYIQSSVKEQIFAEEGDSGSLICFEATGSPQLLYLLADLCKETNILPKAKNLKEFVTMFQISLTVVNNNTLVT